MQLILRTLTSPYNDITKGSVLSHQDLDGNQINLKGEIIYTATTNGGLITLEKLNGNNVQFSLPENGITGGTYNSSNGELTLINSTGGTFNINGFFTSQDDVYVSGLTFDTSSYDLTILRNDGVDFTQNLSILSSDLTITGGTYNPSNGVATFINNSGGTFNISGFTSGLTDTIVSGFTSNGVDTLTINNSNGVNLTTSFTNMWTTGSTGTKSIKAFNSTGLDATGDYSVASGYQTLASGFASFVEGSGSTANGNFSHAGGVNSIASGETSFVHGNNSIAIGTNTVVLGANISGVTDDTTYVDYLNIKNISGNQSVNLLGVDSLGNVVSGFSATFTGGTVSGETIFTNGITANTISATTYQNLPLDIRVTGGTVSGDTAVFINNTGGTFSVTGFTTPSYILLRLNQTSTLTPTLVSQKNNLGLVDVDFSFTRLDVGDYEITFANLPFSLTDLNTYLFSQTFQGSFVTNLYWVSSTKIGLTTKDSTTGASSDGVDDVYIKMDIF